MLQEIELRDTGRRTMSRESQEALGSHQLGHLGLGEQADKGGRALQKAGEEQKVLENNDQQAQCR